MYKQLSNLSYSVNNILGLDLEARAGSLSSESTSPLLIIPEEILIFITDYLKNFEIVSYITSLGKTCPKCLLAIKSENLEELKDDLRSNSISSFIVLGLIF